MPVERSDIDRIEDNLRSELAWLRGRIDGLIDREGNSDRDIIDLKNKISPIEKKLNDQSTKIDRLFYAFITLLIVIIGVIFVK